MKTRKSKRIFGMSQTQALILTVMTCFACVTITGLAGFIIYNVSFGSQQTLLQPAMLIPEPTVTKVQLTRTPLPTTKPQPTFTKAPTKTKLPTVTITPTPTLWFQTNAGDFIPAEQKMPSGYKISIPSSGSDSDQYGNSTTTVYTSDYPNRNKTEDPYLVVYTASIFTTVGFATSTYDRMNESWISSNWKNWFNSSLVISPSQVEFNINGVERATTYISKYNGVSVPEFFVFIKLQSHNGVFTIKTLSHGPSNDEQRALANANYFASLLISKLTP